MYLTLVKKIGTGRGSKLLCQCTCGTRVLVSPYDYDSGHRKTCGSKPCTSKLLAEKKTGKARLDLVGKTPHNWIDRTGTKHEKLTFLEHLGGTRWKCLCDCGNETEVLTTNLIKTKGCKHCANRKNIKGIKIGLLTAVSCETGPVKGRHPIWTFVCDCGNEIEGVVREFLMGVLRSCGCHDNAYYSWSSMMARCYNPTNNRYNSYGGRGITVCKRWHKFNNFITDMGERPKRHNLGRIHAERNYGPSNCFWEHVSKNCRDTKNDGSPTKAGKAKGAKNR